MYWGGGDEKVKSLFFIAKDFRILWNKGFPATVLLLQKSMLSKIKKDLNEAQTKRPWP